MKTVIAYYRQLDRQNRQSLHTFLFIVVGGVCVFCFPRLTAAVYIGMIGGIFLGVIYLFAWLYAIIAMVVLGIIRLLKKLYE